MKDLQHVLSYIALGIGVLCIAGISFCGPQKESSETEHSTNMQTEAALSEICGGIAGIACASSNYCAMDAGLCIDVTDAAGICQPKPEMCTEEYRPVCGCDGQTYSNSCKAASAGINVAITGACINQ